MNQSFHGVILDSLLKYSEDDSFPKHLETEKRQLGQLMQEGLRQGYIRPLPRTIYTMDRVEDAFRFLASGKHIGKVVIEMDDSRGQGNQLVISPEPAALSNTSFDPKKSYLMIGGFGGVGLELLQWMSHKGAQHFMVNSRKGISNKYQQFIVDRLESTGVTVHVSQTDCTSQSGAQKLIREAIKVSPSGKLGGIFNSALVLYDSMFTEQNFENFMKVYEPKAQVAIHLDQVARKLCPDMDYFVCFSSLSGIRGNIGQTNYNFANSLMDSLCDARKRDGLPSLSVALGLVGDVGFVSDMGSLSGSRELTIAGSAAQRINSIMSCLDRFLSYPVGISNVSCHVRPQQVEGASAGEKADLIKMVGNILGIKDFDSLDANTTLASLGVDSLMAVEIKQTVESVTGQEFSQKDLKDMTVGKLRELNAEVQAGK